MISIAIYIYTYIYIYSWRKGKDTHTEYVQFIGSEMADFFDSIAFPSTIFGVFGSIGFIIVIDMIYHIQTN